MADEQNVVITGGVTGDLATTSFGPRKTNKTTGSARPMSWAKRQLVMQLDGDEMPNFPNALADPDFTNDTLTCIPKGALVLEMYAYTTTVGGADVSVYLEDELGNKSIEHALNPLENSWVIEGMTAIPTLARTQLVGTIAAGDTATVIIEYITAEAGENGVLVKAS